jgi:anti-sigma regulatory factor (Ser/Thr protein kinase)
MGTAPGSTPAEAPSARPAGPWHEALAYSSPGELAMLLAGRVGPAVAAGDLVTAVLENEAEQQLRAELGGAAAGVEFLDPSRVHTVPGFTTAVRWARHAGRVPDSRRAMIVGQQLLDLPGCDHEYWLRLCLGLEVSGAQLPLTVLCPFRDEAAGWARIRPTHPLLGSATGSVPNPDRRSPHEVVCEHPPPPRPELGPPAAELRFRAVDLGQLRHLTAEFADRGGLEPERAADVVLAVNELASNSIEHGPGSGRLRLWVGGRRGLLAEVADGGRLAELFPGMVRPDPAGPRGRGLWLASELCDVMEVWTDDGTVVRLNWLG